jgi:hypothetical protein
MAAIACDEELSGPPPTMEVPTLPNVTAEGIRAAVVLEQNDRDGVVLAVRFDETAERLGAYQGSLTFKTDVYRFVEASVPEDGYRVFNDATAEQGVIKFAGFAVEGFSEREALRVQLRPRATFDPSKIGLLIDVVGTLEGVAIPRQRVAVLGGVYSDLNRGN